MLVNESIPRDLLRLVVWYPLRWLILILPVKLGIALLQIMGDMHYRLPVNKKRVVERNLDILKKNSPKHGNWNTQSVREYFRNHYIDHLLILIFPRLDIKKVKSFIDIEGLINIDEALNLGRGVILVHGHFGPVHLPLVALAKLGYRIKQIGLPSDEGLSWIGKNVAFRLRMNYESMMPAEIIRADSFIRGAIRWLNENRIIMVTGDGSGTEKQFGKHEVFTLFGQPMMFPLGPAIMSEKQGRQLFPYLLHRE